MGKRLPSWRLHGCNSRCCKWQVGQDAANQLTDQPAINERRQKSYKGVLFSIWDFESEELHFSEGVMGGRWAWSSSTYPRVAVYLWIGGAHSYICSGTCMHPGAGFNARSVANKPDRYRCSPYSEQNTAFTIQHTAYSHHRHAMNMEQVVHR